MSDIYDRQIEQRDETEQVVATQTFRYEYSGGTGGELTIGLLTVDSDGNEIVKPGVHQQWKCTADGGREPFADAADAFAWADSVTGA
jgi:hypothetical protein